MEILTRIELEKHVHIKIICIYRQTDYLRFLHLVLPPVAFIPFIVLPVILPLILIVVVIVPAIIRTLVTTTTTLVIGKDLTKAGLGQAFRMDEYFKPACDFAKPPTPL